MGTTDSGGANVANTDRNSTSKTGPDSPTEVRLNPGDVAPPGTPGTGEDVCPQCHGSGKLQGQPCQNCGGTGKVIKGIAGG